MRRFIIIALSLLAVLSCTAPSAINPYDGQIYTLTVKADYPQEFASFARGGVPVTVEDINLGTSYRLKTDKNGLCDFRLSKGLYRVMISDVGEEDIFNGTSDKVIVKNDCSVTVPLRHSRPGKIVFKEIYCGGCPILPQGKYQSDQYLILHNNNFETVYLDGLCLGTLCPYNSNSNNPFVTRDEATSEIVYPDFVPVIQAVWQFAGDGKTLPLAPGEDAVVCLRGAIDHTLEYPNSVNLNRPGYFVCYNNTYFTNPTYHPAPGDKIALDHYLDVVVKLGQANAYTFSINSPAVILFQAKDISMKEFVELESSVIQVPGSTVDRVVKVPLDWVIDAVEVFNGSSASNTKRLQPSLDAGYVVFSETFMGRTLFRRTDEALSASFGYEVLADTNNSTEDFYERQTQSLHE
ncbi:MAG: DUF4876 domain-containing protein [Bacteroidales bacterium]|nr:DUF4876 domain-containing protein [Bacteroidales bacterium]